MDAFRDTLPSVTEAPAAAPRPMTEAQSLTHRPRWSPIWRPMMLFVPLVLTLVLVNGVVGGLSVWEWIGLPMAGLFLWTLLEYLIHAFAFHPRPLSGWLKEVQASHAMHHAYPKRPEYIVARYRFTVPVAVLIFLLLWLLVGDWQRASLILVGTVIGYLAYEAVHWSIHRRWAVRFLPRRLVLHHLHHHFKDDQRCYGVTTPLWDYVFGTGPKPSRVERPSSKADEAVR